MKRPTYVLAVTAFSCLLVLISSGTATAAGGTFCSLNQTPCTPPFYKPVGTAVAMSLVTGTVIVKENSFSTTKCTTSEVAGSTETTGSTTLPVEVPLSKANFGSCSGCSVATLKPGRWSVTGIEGTMHGTVRWSGFEFKETCSGLGECIRGGEITKGITLKGGSEPKVKFEKVSMPRQSGSLTACPPTFLSGEYRISNPTPLYVTSASSWAATGQGVLCQAGISPCNEFFAWQYGAGTSISASLKPATTSLFELGYANVKCETSTMSGEVLSSGGSTEPVVGKLSTLSFSNCNCKVTTLKSGNFSFAWTSGGNGTLALDGYELSVDCGGKECTLGTGTKEGIAVTGGEPATIKFSSAPLPKKSGIAECSSTPKWTAEYEVTAPKSLFVVQS